MIVEKAKQHIATAVKTDIQLPYTEVNPDIVEFCTGSLSISDRGAAAQNNQSSQGADDDGIGKYFKDTEQTLFHRFSGIRTGMGDGSGTKTGFVGEDTTGNSFFMLRKKLPTTPPVTARGRKAP